MTPEIWQIYASAVYCLAFFCLGLVMWRKKKKRSKALRSLNPCAVYLRIRFETAKLFESKDSTSTESRFHKIKMMISDLIVAEIEVGFLASQEHKTLIESKRFLLEKKIGSLYENLDGMFLEHQDRMLKIKKAMAFEATSRLIAHPYDIVGMRRMKVFGESLEKYLQSKSANNNSELMAKVKIAAEGLKAKMNKKLCIQKEGIRHRAVKVIKILSVLVLSTLAINGNDTFQDYNVIKTFWTIANNGRLLDQELFTSVILLRFYPVAMFLTGCLIFALITSLFHLPSLWIRYKVGLQMESYEVEQGMETIDPYNVVNQHNFPVSESFGESTMQLMVQWGVYFSFSWFITWRLKLSDEDREELKEVDEILGFSNLHMSLVSSILSLTYAQYLLHSISTKYITSSKQKMIYFATALFNTLCSAIILISWLAYVTDIGIDLSLEPQSTPDFQNPILAIKDCLKCQVISGMMLITPVLYKYMVLPTSNNKLNSSTLNCEDYYRGVMLQCFTNSLYIGSIFLTTSYMYMWGPEQKVSLSDVAFNITGNMAFPDMDPSEFTPSQVYEGDPINSRLVLIIAFCVGIPITWVISYFGLYMYFKEWTSKVQYTLISQGRPVGTEDAEFTQKSAVKEFKKIMVNLINSRPALVGRWQDLNCIKNDRDVKNEVKVRDFLLNISLEDRKLIGEIKASFPCWMKDDEEEPIQSSLQKTLRILKICCIGIAFCFVTFAFGFLLKNAEYFATFGVNHVL